MNSSFQAGDTGGRAWIKFFLDKMKAQENQTDSFAKLVKDLVVRKAIAWVKAAAPIIGLVLLLLVLLTIILVNPRGGDNRASKIAAYVFCNSFRITFSRLGINIEPFFMIFVAF